MPPYETVHLVLTPTGHSSRVFVNGREVQGLLSVKVEASVEKLTTVTLSFYAQVSAEGADADDVTARAIEEYRHLRSGEPSR